MPILEVHHIEKLRRENTLIHIFNAGDIECYDFFINQIADTRMPIKHLPITFYHGRKRVVNLLLLPNIINQKGAFDFILPLRSSQELCSLIWMITQRRICPNLRMRRKCPDGRCRT